MSMAATGTLRTGATNKSDTEGRPVANARAAVGADNYLGRFTVNYDVR